MTSRESSAVDRRGPYFLSTGTRPGNKSSTRAVGGHLGPLRSSTARRSGQAVWAAPPTDVHGWVNGLEPHEVRHVGTRASLRLLPARPCPWLVRGWVAERGSTRSRNLAV